MKGLLGGVIINCWFSYFVNIGLVSKYIGYKWIRQIVDLLPIAMVSAVSAIVSYLITGLFHLNVYLDGVLKALIVFVIYLGWSILFKPESYSYFLTIIPKRFRFWEKKMI